MNSTEQKVFDYFLQFIGSFNLDELQLLLHFITGSSVVLADTVDVTFNATSGLSRSQLPIPVALLLNFLQRILHNLTLSMIFAAFWIMSTTG